MIEAVIAIIGSVAGLLIYDFVTKYLAAKNQDKLEKEVAEIKAKAEKIQDSIDNKDKETQDKIDAIDKEKETELSGESLANWFENRK